MLNLIFYTEIENGLTYHYYTKYSNFAIRYVKGLVLIKADIGLCHSIILSNGKRWDKVNDWNTRKYRMFNELSYDLNKHLLEGS